jgi:hypothetical protein
MASNIPLNETIQRSQSMVFNLNVIEQTVLYRDTYFIFDRLNVILLELKALCSR